MSQETDFTTSRIGSLSLSLSLLLSACQGATEEQRTLVLDQDDKLLLDCGSAFVEEILHVLSFLAGKDACIPGTDELATFVRVMQAVLKNLGKKGYPREASGIKTYFGSIADTLSRITTLGAGWIDPESVRSAREFFVDMANSLPGEIVEERARVIVHIPEDMIRGLRKTAQEDGVTVGNLVAQAIAETVERKGISIHGGPASRKWALPHLRGETEDDGRETTRCS